MRIERVEIDGFGRFHEAAWALGDGLTVFLGANEAGKTTLLNALRALLFGFEASRDGRTWYAALAGGRRGGRLVLRARDGARWTVERHGERGGAGALVVRAPNGNQGGQETLDRLLGGADRDLFANIFAFGLGELQTLASLSAEGVRGRIYGAGAGLGGPSAVDLERRLRQQLDAVFLPRGRERPLNQLLARIEDLRRTVADLGRQPTEHAEAHRERATLLVHAAELRQAVRAERERAARGARLLGARAPAAEVALLVDELAAGDSTLDLLPPDAVALLERHVATLDGACAAATELAQELGDATRARERIQPDESMLAVGDRVLAMRDEHAARTGAAAGRHALEATAARHARAVDEQVARAGGLDERRLVALDDSIAAVERTRELERQLADARTRASEAERRHRLLAEELDVRELEATPVAPGTSAADRLEALEALDALRLRRAIAEARGSTRPPAGLGPVVGALVLAAALLIGIVAGEPLVGALGGVALGLGAAVALRLLAAPAPSGLAELEAERRALLGRAGLPPDADDAAVRRAATEAATDRARADLAAEHRAGVEARRHQLEAAERELAAAREDLVAVEAAWEAWLRHAGLPHGLSPETARQLLTTAGSARRAAVERDEHRDRLAELAREEAGLGERIGELARLIGATPPDEGGRGAFLVSAVERLEAARESERRSRDLDAAIERLTERHRSAESASEDAERRLGAFLAELGCSDPDGLRRRDAEAAARRSTAARVRELRAQLAGMAGGAEAVDALIEAALAADPAELEASVADAREQVERLEADEREVLNRIGALDARIEQLERADELGARRQELAMLEGRAAALARAWAVRALALRLLEETRFRYERERQPDVVRAATGHFERITGGRYARVVAPPGEPGVRVETEGGEARTTDELSRGTAEQLYLALRFGLIEEFARSAEPLPVVMDDILVNFDAERAARAASAIRDLAERHQVLYFTCHRPLATLLDPEGDRTLVLD